MSQISSTSTWPSALVKQCNINNNLYSDQQIKVVGNPRYDEYIFNPETFEKSIKLLIATSFGIANPNYLNKKQNKKAFLNANMSQEEY